MDPVDAVDPVDPGLSPFGSIEFSFPLALDKALTSGIGNKDFQGLPCVSPLLAAGFPVRPFFFGDPRSHLSRSPTRSWCVGPGKRPPGTCRQGANASASSSWPGSRPRAGQGLPPIPPGCSKMAVAQKNGTRSWAPFRETKTKTCVTAALQF